MPPNKAEVAFRLDVGDREDPQDILLDFEGNGPAGHHGNPQPGHDRPLDPLTALEDQRVVLHEMCPVEHAFDHLAGGRARLAENPGLSDEIGQRHRRARGQAVVRGHNEHQGISPRGLDVELGMLQGNANHAQIPLPRQHAVDHPLAVGNLHLQGDAGIARDKGRQHGRQEIDPGCATGAQAERAPLQPLQFAQRPLGRVPPACG